MRTSRILATAGLMAALFGCVGAAPADDTAADVEAIHEVREREGAAFSSGDVEAMLALLTPDAHIMPPGEPTIRGHEGVRAWMEAVPRGLEVSARYTSSTVEVFGDHAIERYAGELTITQGAGGESTVETLKGIHVYRRQPDGTWRIHQDVWNADPRPAGDAGAGSD